MVCLYLHFRWPVSPSGAPFTPEMIGKVAPYLTRYGQTLGATVFAVGGDADHLHVLLDAPVTRTINEINNELQIASERFVRETLNTPLFAWHETDGGFVVSVGLDAPETMSGYIRNNWDIHASGTAIDYYEDVDAPWPERDPNEPMPQWLMDALEDTDSRTRH